MMPSASDLAYFMEVAIASNLSRASERLGISQPSLTLAVQRLERSIGTALFIRSKKGVTLTQAGKQLLAHSRSLLQSWEVVKSRALSSTHSVQGGYTLGCHPSVALYMLPYFLPDLLEKYPELELRLVHQLSRKITESVISTEIDFGIVVNPIKHPDLVIRKLCNDEVTFWVGQGKRKIQDFRSGQAVLICDPELLQTQALLKNLKKSGINYRRILSSSNLEVITALTSAGAGIGIIPGRVAAAVSSLSRISTAPLFQDEICLLYRVENKNLKSIQVIGEMIQSVFREKSDSK